MQLAECDGFKKEQSNKDGNEAHKPGQKKGTCNLIVGQAQMQDQDENNPAGENELCQVADGNRGEIKAWHGTIIMPIAPWVVGGRVCSDQKMGCWYKKAHHHKLHFDPHSENRNL